MYVSIFSLLHYAKRAVNGQGILVWEELTADSLNGDPRQPFLQALKAAFEVSSSTMTVAYMPFVWLSTKFTYFHVSLL